MPIEYPSPSLLHFLCVPRFSRNNLKLLRKVSKCERIMRKISMSCTVGTKKMYESQTHGVASHSSTKDEGSPSCASTASKSCMSHKLIVAGHSSTKHEGPPHIKTLIEMSAGSCFLHAYVHICSKHILCHINTMRIILIVTCLGFSMSILA